MSGVTPMNLQANNGSSCGEPLKYKLRTDMTEEVKVCSKSFNLNDFALFAAGISQGSSSEAVTLYRIQALRDFGDVKFGDIGGFVQSEANLDQMGECWIYGDAKVYGDANIYSEAKVMDNAEVLDEARVGGRAVVRERAVIKGKASISGCAIVSGSAEVSGNARVMDFTEVTDSAKVTDHASVADHAIVGGTAWIEHYTRIFGHMVATAGSEQPLYFEFNGEYFCSVAPDSFMAGPIIKTLDEWYRDWNKIITGSSVLAPIESRVLYCYNQTCKFLERGWLRRSE